MFCLRKGGLKPVSDTVVQLVDVGSSLGSEYLRENVFMLAIMWR
jgi:hypothetical protein